MKTNTRLCFFYILLHLAAITAFGISAAKGRFSVSSDLFSMIPKTSENRALEIADKKLTGNSGKEVFILSKAEDFNSAKKNAEAVCKALRNAPEFSDFFESLTLYSDGEAYTEIFDFIRKYRSNLLDEKTVRKLETEYGIRDFAEASLAGIYSGFSMAPLDDLENDPYFLDEVHLRRLMQILNDSGTSMSLKDGVLAAQFEGQWFVMIQGALTDKGAALAQKKNGVQLIYDVCLPMEGDDAAFVFSGTPFHSHKSSTNASFEISLMSTISLLTVLAMLIFVFLSPLPIFAAFTSILISITFAFSSTAAIFGQVHALTLVFGTSLIGSCIDYSLHFFTHWAGNKELKDGFEIRNHIFSGLVMAIISTGICFAILLFAPFTILRQMSLFCLTGLLSSFLTTVSIYPYIRLPKNRGNVRFVNSFSKVISFVQQKWFGRTMIAVLFVASMILLAIFHSNLKIKNNVLLLAGVDAEPDCFDE